jgi:hypothetical protein
MLSKKIRSEDCVPSTLSEVLSPTKQRYPHYQKLTYSVFTTAQKLWQYFVVHPIIVVNEAPLSNILNNPSAT